MRRLCTTVALVLLVGATLNVAVAWACCLWLEVFSGEYEGLTKRLDSSNAFDVKRHTRAGATYFEIYRLRGWQPAAPPVSQQDLDNLIPKWTGLQTPGAAYEAGEVNPEHRAVDLRGWPMPSLWLELVSDPSDSGILNVVGGINTGRVRQVTWSATPQVLNRYGNALPLALPFRPRWPGFAVNTIAYAVVAAVILCVPQNLRRRWRMRHGRCPICSYPVGATTTCSECGSTVQSDQVA